MNALVMPVPAVLASLAVAGGIGVLAGILIMSLPSFPGRVDAGSRAPRRYLAWLDHHLALAGRPPAWSINRIILAKPLAALAGAILATVWIGADPALLRWVLGSLLVVLCSVVPDLLLVSRGQERQNTMQESLADTLDQMTVAVEAGLGFESAMAHVARAGTGPLADELVRTLQDVSIGRARRQAYQSLAARTSSPDLRRFTRSIIQADAYGLALGDVLRVQAGEMRLRRRQRAEEKAMKIPVKVLFPLIFCILPVLFIVLLTPAVLGMVAAFS
jgi:tight adherence protein C